MSTDSKKVAVALLTLRVSLFAVLLVWTLDKLVNPAHTAQVLSYYYKVDGVGMAATRVLGGAELALLLAFLAGIAKRWTYGIVLLMHASSTLVAYKQYLEPFAGGHMLYFAAWPMLAACFTLYWLRDMDTLLTVSPSRSL